jgi:hypothetical protein
LVCVGDGDKKEFSLQGERVVGGFLPESTDTLDTKEITYR